MRKLVYIFLLLSLVGCSSSKKSSKEKELNKDIDYYQNIFDNNSLQTSSDDVTITFPYKENVSVKISYNLDNPEDTLFQYVNEETGTISLVVAENALYLQDIDGNWSYIENNQHISETIITKFEDSKTKVSKLIKDLKGVTVTEVAQEDDYYSVKIEDFGEATLQFDSSTDELLGFEGNYSDLNISVAYEDTSWQDEVETASQEVPSTKTKFYIHLSESFKDVGII